MCLYSGFDFFSISCSCLLLPGVHPEGGKVIHGEKHAGRTSEEKPCRVLKCYKCLGVALQETLIAFCIEHGVMKN